jgi:hypothetical protein
LLKRSEISSAFHERVALAPQNPSIVAREEKATARGTETEHPMSLHSATPVVIAFARYFNRPRCPQCGDEQFVPERAEFAGEGCIRHTWSCDTCGNEFRTAVELGLAAA